MRRDIAYAAMEATIKQMYARDILDHAQLLAEIACISSTQLISASSIPRAERPDHRVDLEAFREKSD